DLTLDGARHPLDDAIFRPGAGGHFILFLRESEQNDRRYPQRACLAHFLYCLVYRKIEDPGHRAHFFPDSLSGANKQWIHQRFRSKTGLADQSAQGFGAPQTAKTVSGESHDTAILAAVVPTRRPPLDGYRSNLG